MLYIDIQRMRITTCIIGQPDILSYKDIEQLKQRILKDTGCESFEELDLMCSGGLYHTEVQRDFETQKGVPIVPISAIFNEINSLHELDQWVEEALEDVEMKETDIPFALVQAA